MIKKTLPLAAVIFLTAPCYAGGAEWWSADSSFTSCFKVKGPAETLDSFVGYADKPETRDFKDRDGQLWKVEVRNEINGGRQTQVWTYYRSKYVCESEKVNATKSLADKYR